MTAKVPVYEPKPVIQGDGHPLQWLNCTCASGACLLDRDTEGRQRATSGHVRNLTHDNVGGNTLDQIDSALREGFPPGDHMDSRRREAFEDACHEVASGRGAEVQIGYDGGLAGSSLDGSPGFRGNHAIYWNEVRLIYLFNGLLDHERSLAKIWDPLWDGRRKGIPGYVGPGKKPKLAFRWIKLSLLRRLAGALRMNNGNRLGGGYCYIGYSRVTTPPETNPVPQPSPIKYGANKMIVAGGLVLTSSHVVSVKKDQKFYREPKATSDVISLSSDDHAYDYFGYGAPGWYAVLIVTGNFADKVKRPVLVFCPRAAGPVSRKV